MSENEKLADIRRESEEEFREFCANWIGTKKMSWGCELTQAMMRFNRIFDRIEEAAKRELNANSKSAQFEFCNIAKMREALEKLKEAYYETEDGWPRFDGSICPDVLGVIEAAIAAPPRNCDVYDKEEVRMAYHLHGDGLMTMQAVVDWLYSAKKEHGDESPSASQESGVQG